ncbi:conserved hypothetical protein [Enterobacterales bacterium 8AC]|nr:conserved hypothetical protein [Enterobacterales bacterium 8AC]
MFSQSKTRIRLLAVVGFVTGILFYIEGFAGFATGWSWQRSYRAEQPAVVMSKQRLSSFQQGVLLTGVSDAIDMKLLHIDRATWVHSYQKTIQIDLLASDAPPLLNLQISPDTEAVRSALERHTGNENSRTLYLDDAIVPVTQIITEQEGDLRISARFLGTVMDQECSAQGQCLVLFNSYLDRADVVFYSADGGRRWQWQPQWQAPEKDSAYRLLGIHGPERVLVSQNGKLYQSDDLGQHWQMLLDLAQQGVNTALNPTYWRYNDDQYVTVWSGASESGDDESGHLLLNFNLNTLRIESNWWMQGTVIDGESTTQGDFYFILESQPRVRYSLHKLQADGTFYPVLETGKKTLAALYAGNNLLMMEKQFNDPLHMTVSTDGGQHWFRMEKFPSSYDESVLFDRWRNRLFRFPAHAYSYPRLGNREGLVYETATLPH